MCRNGILAMQKRLLCPRSVPQISRTVGVPHSFPLLRRPDRFLLHQVTTAAVQQHPSSIFGVESLAFGGGVALTGAFATLFRTFEIKRHNRVTEAPSHEEVKRMIEKRGKEILNKKIFRETAVVNETARKVVMDRMSAPRCSVDVIYAKSGMGKSTVVNTMGKEAVEKGILDGENTQPQKVLLSVGAMLLFLTPQHCDSPGFYMLSMSDIVKQSDKANFESIIAQDMGAPPNFTVHRISDMIEDGKIVGIHIDQAEVLANHKSDIRQDDVATFVLALSGDAANSSKFRVFLSTNDPLFAETLPQLNGYTKVFALFDFSVPFPAWSRDMLTTHLKEEVSR